MLWLKRNFLFAIGSLIGLGLLGGAGYFLFTASSENKGVEEQLGAEMAESDRLGKLDPYPNPKNIEAVKADQQRVLDYVGQASRAFKPMNYHKISSSQFRTELQDTIHRLRKQADQSSVSLPTNYNFSFEAQAKILNFAPNSIPMLAEQLIEISSFCSVLFQGKVNRLEGIKRVRVSTDDPTGSADYVEQRPITNALTGAVLSPYEVTVLCFSPELAAMLEGLMRSPYGFIVQTMTVEPAPSSALPQPEAPQPVAPVYYPMPMPMPSAVFPGPKSDASRPGMNRELMMRYGMGRIPQPTPQPQYRPAAPAAPPKTLTTVLNEKVLRVTLRIEVLRHVTVEPAKRGK